MAKITRDLSAGNLHPRENLFGTASLAATNAEIQVAADGSSTLACIISGTYVGTIAIDGSIDGINWTQIPIKFVNNGGTYFTVLASGQVGQFTGAIGQFSKIRARMTAWTSGAAAVTLVSDNGVTEVTALLKASDLSQTTTAAISTAATLTLPAAGSGLFHYITRIIIQRHTGAVLTAAATPIVVTTTNMQGARAFSIPADAAAQGQVYTEIVEPATPLRSTSVNTATTIVAPVVTGVIWRITADYYAAP